MYPQKRMVRQALRRGLPGTVGVVLLALLLALAVVGVVGCGGGGGQPQQQQEAKARAVPEYGDLRPGKYVTDDTLPRRCRTS
jgi:hypothetical protein